MGAVAVFGGNVVCDTTVAKVDSILVAMQAVYEINQIKEDQKNLPKNLMEIFQKYAVKSALGDGFVPCTDIVADEQYDLGFVSRVLTQIFPVIGNGSFSEVFDLGEGWVLKSNCHDRYWSPRDGCFTWLRECIRHQSNPYLPKLMSLEQSSHLYFAVVEKLEGDIKFNIVDGSLGDLAFESYDPEFDVKRYIDESDFTFAGFISHSPKDAIEASRFFESYRDRVGGVSDCEGFDNILHRNGFPVLSDPICDVVDGCAMLNDGMKFSWMLGD